MPIGRRGLGFHRSVGDHGVALGIGDIQLLYLVGLARLRVLGGVGGRFHGLLDLAGCVGAALVLLPAAGADHQLGLQGPDQLDQIRFQGLVGPAILHVRQLVVIVIQEPAQEGGLPVAQGPEGGHRLVQGPVVAGHGLEHGVVLAEIAVGGLQLILAHVQGGEAAKLLEEGLGLTQQDQHVRLLEGRLEADQVLRQRPVEEAHGADRPGLGGGNGHLAAVGVQLVPLEGGGGAHVLPLDGAALSVRLDDGQGLGPGEPGKVHGRLFAGGQVHGHGPVALDGGPAQKAFVREPRRDAVVRQEIDALAGHLPGRALRLGGGDQGQRQQEQGQKKTKCCFFQVAFHNGNSIAHMPRRRNGNLVL